MWNIILPYNILKKNNVSFKIWIISGLIWPLSGNSICNEGSCQRQTRMGFSLFGISVLESSGFQLKSRFCEGVLSRCKICEKQVASKDRQYLGEQVMTTQLSQQNLLYWQYESRRRHIALQSPLSLVLPRMSTLKIGFCSLTPDSLRVLTSYSMEWKYATVLQLHQTWGPNSKWVES